MRVVLKSCNVQLNECFAARRLLFRCFEQWLFVNHSCSYGSGGYITQRLCYTNGGLELKVIWMTQVTWLRLGIHPVIWRKQEIEVTWLKGAEATVKLCIAVNVLWQWVKLALKTWDTKWSHDWAAAISPSLSFYQDWLLAAALCCDICLPPPRSRKCPGTSFLCCWRHINPARQPGTDS